MKDNILPRFCKSCGITFLGGPRAFYCPECRQERKKEQYRIYHVRKRCGSVVPIGSIIKCEICGKEILKNGGAQRYCTQCAKKHLKMVDNQQSLDWNKNNQDKVKKANKKYSAKKQSPVINKNSGVPGVNWDKIKDRWIAYISINHKQIKIATTKNLNVAVAARKEAQKAKEDGLLTNDFIEQLKTTYRNL